MKATIALLFLGFILSVFSDDELVSRIINGQDAAPGQFPYQALILRYNNNTFQCGGSLISNQWILSAAHCLGGLEKGVNVYLGVLKFPLLKGNEEQEGMKKIWVPKENVIRHKGWDNIKVINDIALIKLPNPVEFTAYIRPVALPAKKPPYPTYAGDYAYASGFGAFNTSSDVSSSVLQWIKRPIITIALCNDTYTGFIHDTNICIDTMGKHSTCFGDSGGPLVLAGPKPELVGIDSFGNVTCDTNDPVSFTRVTSYLDWIEENSDLKLS